MAPLVPLALRNTDSPKLEPLTSASVPKPLQVKPIDFRREGGTLYYYVRPEQVSTMEKQGWTVVRYGGYIGADREKYRDLVLIREP